MIYIIQQYSIKNFHSDGTKNYENQAKAYYIFKHNYLL